MPSCIRDVTQIPQNLLFELGNQAVLSKQKKEEEKKKRREYAEKNRTIYCDPSYQETTMQDFVINWAKMHRQRAVTMKEDFLTKRFTKRTTITENLFNYTRQYSKRTRALISRHAETASFLQEVQPCLAVRDSSGSLTTPNYIWKVTPYEESCGNLNNIVKPNSCMYSGVIRRSPPDWKSERAV